MFTQINTPKFAKYKGNGAINSHNYGQSRIGTVAWFEQKIKQGETAPFAEVVTITPEIAKFLLGNNDDNRRVYENRAIEIAEDIAAGRWQINGETIIVAKDGQLNNGQHRLNAIVIADAPIQTLVFFGAERDSRLTVDMGKSRTVGDFLGMDGVKNCNQAAAISKLLLAWSRGIYGCGKSGYGTKQELRENYYANENDIVEAILAVGHLKFSHKVGKTSVVTAYVILHRVNPEAAKEFFYKLTEGLNLRRGDAILQARSHAMEFASQRLREWEKLELFLKYWNSWRAGRSMSRNHSLARSWPKLEK
jgi:hypothetical protein